MKIEDRSSLGDYQVNRAMRRHFIRAASHSTIGSAIITLIKYKMNGLLVTGESGAPLGVLSKTDIMGAYYAGLPLEMPINDIMAGPPILCRSTDSLEDALERMKENRVYRLYVTEDDIVGESRVVGALAYPDIVGLLYQFCFYCEYSQYRRQANENIETEDVADRVKKKQVRDVMTHEVKSAWVDDTLLEVMELLSVYRFGAILIRMRDGEEVGVISKTDLAIAYRRGIDSAEPARTIMTKPVHHCNEEDYLEDAIRRMIFTDVHRLFIQNKKEEYVGVFSLTDAARSRSGSCHACISSRIRVEEG